MPQSLQVVLNQNQLTIESLDWRGDGKEVQEHKRNSLAESHLATPFDLEAWPLMRLSVAQLGNGKYHFLMTAHHLILDGWSIPLVFNEVFAHYEAGIAGKQLDKLES